ncbi:MAG TPA: hypothetical protein VFQ88_00650 [Nevskiaceae bacterium]|nr:hypothetical protein [Nevskiaceae bacterium]
MLRTDIWRVGILRASMNRIITAGTIENIDTTWLTASDPLQYLADPFGIWRDERLYVFMELFDYRTHRGGIDVAVYDATLAPLAPRRAVLREPWHLSYPFVFEADGETWMLPEAWNSGRLSLYRAIEFPWHWQREPRFTFPVAAIDSTPIHAGDEWWLFYTPPGNTKALRRSVLKLARASSLFGPWREMELPPVRVGLDGSRMGGTPIQHAGTWWLPTQDCRATYGAGVQLQRLPDPAEPRHLETVGAPIRAPAAQPPYTRGLHTLSAAGPFTLVDTKRTFRSWRRLLPEALRRLRPAR